MFEVSYNEVQFYFLNPTWGQGFIGNNKVVEIGCSQVRASYSSSLTKKEFFDANCPSRFKRSKQNKGSLNLTVPLTVGNFDFLFAAQDQNLDFEFPPKAYFAGCLYEGLLFNNMSFVLEEDGVVVMELSFEYNSSKHEALEIVHDICYLTEVVYTDDNILIDSLGNILTTEDDLILTTEGASGTLESEIVFQVDEFGNFIIDPTCASGSASDLKDRFSVTTLLQVAGYANLSLSDRALTMNKSSFVVNAPLNAEQIDFNDLSIISMSLSYACDFKGVKKMGQCVPSKLIKQSHELSSTLNFAMLEEMTQTGFVGSQESDGVKYGSFVASILLKDVAENAVATTINIDAQLHSIESSVSSLGVPQGSLQIKQQIKQ